MGNFLTNPETDPDFLRWIDQMDLLVKHRVSEGVGTDERFSTLDFSIIANINSKWAYKVKQTLQLDGEGVSDMIGILLDVWSLDVNHYREYHIMALYCLSMLLVTF